MEQYGVLIFSVVILALTIFLLASFWKVFTKAGKPGWASLIPIYNTYVLIKIANRPGWWLLLVLFVPFVNIVIWLIVSMDIAKAFGKSSLFGALALWLFYFIGFPILAFGDSKYIGGDKQGSVSAESPVLAPATPPSPVVPPAQ